MLSLGIVFVRTKDSLKPNIETEDIQLSNALLKCSDIFTDWYRIISCNSDVAWIRFFRIAIVITSEVGTLYCPVLKYESRLL